MIEVPCGVYQLFETAVLPAVPPPRQPLVRAALRFAADAHRGQRRDEGTPYIEHPVRVAAVLAGTGFGEAEVLAAALLHDTLEDCAVTEAELERGFGSRVAGLVRAVTKREVLPGSPPTVDLRTMSLEAKAIKLADRLDNLRSLHRSPDARKRWGMLEETYWRYLPVAREVGGRLGREFLAWWERNGSRR